MDNCMPYSSLFCNCTDRELCSLCLMSYTILCNLTIASAISPLTSSKILLTSSSLLPVFSMTNLTSSSLIPPSLLSSCASPIICQLSCPDITTLVILAFSIIILPSFFSIITLLASISSCFIPICFIICCIFLGSIFPIPGNIKALKKQLIYSFLKKTVLLSTTRPKQFQSKNKNNNKYNKTYYLSWAKHKLAFI